MDVTHHKLSSQELANYLQRIHLVSPPKATDIDGLKELQIHHLLSIPYENLDPMNGISTSMDSEDLYKKMILHRRGGYWECDAGEPARRHCLCGAGGAAV